MAATLATPHVAVACGSAEPLETAANAPREIQTPIYRINDGNRSTFISRSRLDGSERREYTRHDFEDDNGEFDLRAMSADRRFALFEYGPGAGKRKNLLLFDGHSGNEKIVLTLPESERMYADFSPDGSQVAIYAFDDEPGLYLIDTRTGESRSFPTTGAQEKDGSPAFSVPYWSQDGSALFVRSSGAAPGYFRFDPKSEKFQRVRGWKATDTHRYGVLDRPEFLLRGRRSAVQPEIEPQSGVLADTAHSPNGALATVDEKGVLWIEVDGKRRRVAGAPPEPPPHVGPQGERVTLACGGEFGIQGWIEDRILVYRIDLNAYGYDVASGASFLLSQGYGEYWW